MWTLFLIQTNDTIHLWQSSNWIFLTTPFTSLFSTSLCHQLTLQPRMASSGILDLSFPPLRFYNYTTHLQSTPPPLVIPRRNGGLFAAGCYLKKASRTYLLELSGTVRGEKQLSPWSLFLAAPQRLPSENSSTQLPWKERESEVWTLNCLFLLIMYYLSIMDKRCFLPSSC